MYPLGHIIEHSSLNLWILGQILMLISTVLMLLSKYFKKEIKVQINPAMFISTAS